MRTKRTGVLYVESLPCGLSLPCHASEALFPLSLTDSTVLEYVYLPRTQCLNRNKRSAARLRAIHKYMATMSQSTG